MSNPASCIQKLEIIDFLSHEYINERNCIIVVPIIIKLGEG